MSSEEPLERSDAAITDAKSAATDAEDVMASSAEDDEEGLEGTE